MIGLNNTLMRFQLFKIYLIVFALLPKTFEKQLVDFFSQLEAIIKTIKKLIIFTIDKLSKRIL